MRSIKHKYTKKNKKSTSLQSFQKEIVVKFMELLVMIKLYHWKTFSYAIHKSTDELYSSLNENVDNFVEVLLGKTGVRTNLTNTHKLSLIDLSNKNQLHKEINKNIDYLINLSNNHFMKSPENSDLLNIRDEIVAILNKFLFLTSFN